MSVNPLSVSAYITIELQYPDFLKKTCHFESHFERRNFVKWEQLILKGFCPCKKKCQLVTTTACLLLCLRYIVAANT